MTYCALGFVKEDSGSVYLGMMENFQLPAVCLQEKKKWITEVRERMFTRRT